MKKLTLWILSIVLLTFLAACNGSLTEITTDYTKEIEEIAERIQEALPSTINRDFDLPQFENYDITYTLKDQTYTTRYIHHAPLYDQMAVMNFTIKRGRNSKTFSHSFYHLAYESGRNQTKIYLTMPVQRHQIDKTIYNQTDVRVETNINGELLVEHETSSAQIRGRGNSTWYSFEKKPYRLRFDKNTSILGMPEAKNYVLLAEYSDKSLMRNVITQKMVSMMPNLPYTNQTRFVELYINNEYLGVYVLTEHVEVHPNKFFIESIPGELNTGYFLEKDMRLYESGTAPGFDWFVISGHPYEIKEPDTSDPNYSINQLYFIEDYFVQVEQALIAQSGYEDLIDLDNWIEHFIIHEFVKNVDVGWSSIFMYKEKDGPLKYGPLWDFDLAMGNADYIDYGPENFYGMRQYKNRMFILMMRIPEVRNKFKEKYLDFYYDVVPVILEMIPHLADSISEMANRNFAKWPTLGHYVWPNPYPMWQITTFSGQVGYVTRFIEDRAAWMFDAIHQEAYLEGNFES
jgi:hypothetical protein